MTLLPVIERELRITARRPFTYWLRVMGAATALAVSFFFGMERSFSLNLGGELFGYLHYTSFWGIWIVVPMMTADCISRERREGTLGLLFLTALRALDIVLAKGLAHGLRALTLWVAVLPVLTIPFLMGGVGWREAVVSVLVNLSSLCWALAAGLLSSSLNKSWLRAVVWAGLLAIVCLILFGWVSGWMLMSSFAGYYSRPMDWEYIFSRGLAFAVSIGRMQNFLVGGGLPAALRNEFLMVASRILGVSLVVVLLMMLWSARNIRRHWQEHPPSELQLWWEKRLCTPIFWVALLKTWMRRKLERNPVGWLELRTWTGRLVTWSWFAVMISLYSVGFAERTFSRGAISDLQKLMAWLLVGSMAVSAAGSFRRERETGVLELLLVSPLSVGQIIGGRLRGLWGQFLPAIVVLLGIWAYFAHLFKETDQMAQVRFYGITFATVPVIGLYFSLVCRNVLSASLCTLGVGLALPFLLVWLTGWVYWANSMMIHLVNPRPVDFVMPASLIQLLLAGFFWHRLHQRLARRSFPLERTVTS